MIRERVNKYTHLAWSYPGMQFTANNYSYIHYMKTIALTLNIHYIICNQLHLH